MTPSSQLTLDQLCTYDSNDSGNIDVVDILSLLGAYNVEFDTSGCVSASAIVDLGGIMQQLTSMQALTDMQAQQLTDMQAQIDGLISAASAPPPAPAQAPAVGTPTAAELIARVTTIESGHYACEDGWGAGTCTEDTRAPTINCESGIVSVLASSESQYTLTATDVPLPTLVDTGPEYGPLTVTLGLTAQSIHGDADSQDLWQMTLSPTASVFDFGAATQTSVNLSVLATVNSAESDPESAAITTFVYTATDQAGNAGTCEVQVHVVDFDECSGEGGGHTCVENAVCENLLTRDDDLATGTYQCRCQEGFEGDGYTLCEFSGCPIYKHYRLVVTDTTGADTGNIQNCFEGLQLGTGTFGQSAVTGWCRPYLADTQCGNGESGTRPWPSDTAVTTNLPRWN
jgi:hypothetical protein